MKSEENSVDSGIETFSKALSFPRKEQWFQSVEGLFLELEESGQTELPDKKKWP